MLGDKNPVDLFKLYAVVRGRGGYETVSRNGLWGLVAKEYGEKELLYIMHHLNKKACILEQRINTVVIIKIPLHIM